MLHLDALYLSPNIHCWNGGGIQTETDSGGNGDGGDGMISASQCW